LSCQYNETILSATDPSVGNPQQLEVESFVGAKVLAKRRRGLSKLPLARGVLHIGGNPNDEILHLGVRVQAIDMPQVLVVKVSGERVGEFEGQMERRIQLRLPALVLSKKSQIR
jgi:hypothetical protein